MNTKDKIAYIFAACALVIGFGLTIAGFVVAPLGIIDNSVLWTLGQCLTFAGAVAGVSLHMQSSKEEIKSQIIHEMRRQ